MKIKDYLIAAGTAAAATGIVTLFIALLVLIGWSALWATLIIAFLPKTYSWAVEYRESNEPDYMSYLIEKIEKVFEDKPKKSEIEW